MLDSEQYYYISVELDSYSMVDLVFISFVKSLELTLCMKLKHSHVELLLKGIGQNSTKTYSFFHLQLCVTDHWNHSLDFIHLFLAVDRDIMDSKV